MSNFYCEKCGAIISENSGGYYITGCEHYPPEIDENGNIKIKQNEKFLSNWKRQHAIDYEFFKLAKNHNTEIEELKLENENLKKSIDIIRALLEKNNIK